MADEGNAEDSAADSISDDKRQAKKNKKKSPNSAFATPPWAEPDEILGTQFTGREK